MKHICKQEWMGCAVATAAMVADLSYDEAAAHSPDLNAAGLRTAQGVASPFGKGDRHRLATLAVPTSAAKRARFPFPPWPVAVFIEDAAPRPRFGQWIVAKADVVHDPGQPRAQSARRYPLRYWLVTWVAQPVCPEQLAAKPTPGSGSVRYTTRCVPCWLLTAAGASGRDDTLDLLPGLVVLTGSPGAGQNGSCAGSRRTPACIPDDAGLSGPPGRHYLWRPTRRP